MQPFPKAISLLAWFFAATTPPAQPSVVTAGKPPTEDNPEIDARKVGPDLPEDPVTKVYDF